ncbi:MAG TPA: hypothetical protein VG944_20055, partial [Fimbriimonas sp.]|nr:hypothetical protein [Fimbriimonas sp.]
RGESFSSKTTCLDSLPCSVGKLSESRWRRVCPHEIVEKGLIAAVLFWVAKENLRPVGPKMRGNRPEPACKGFCGSKPPVAKVHERGEREDLRRAVQVTLLKSTQLSRDELGLYVQSRADNKPFAFAELR